jgi:uncharacterized protein (TIGR03435 family)
MYKRQPLRGEIMSARSSITMFVLFLCLQAAIATQTVMSQSGPQSGIFEVASVKRNVDKLLTMSGVIPSPGRVSVKAVTLKGLIASAYRMKEREIIGCADWCEAERSDIEAKAEENVPWEPQMRLMLQALLAERFHLKIHDDTKQLPVYAAVLAKGGLKLSKFQGECVPTPTGGDCGGVTTMIGRMRAQKARMSQLVDALSSILDRPVLDKTGLPDVFDAFTLEWTPDENQYLDWGSGAYKRSVSDTTGPSLFTALQDQIGIKLESQQGPVKVVIVDHAERPVEN